MTNRQRITVRADEVRVGDLLVAGPPPAPGEPLNVLSVGAPRVRLLTEPSNGAVQWPVEFAADQQVEVERPVPTVTVELPEDAARAWLNAVETSRDRLHPVTTKILPYFRDALAERDNPDSGQPVCDYCGQAVEPDTTGVFYRHKSLVSWDQCARPAVVNGSRRVPEARS